METLPNKLYKKRVSAVVRESTPDQMLAGDRPEEQKKRIRKRAIDLGLGEIDKWFSFAQSASGDLQPLLNTLPFFDEHPNEYGYLIVNNIERGTRGGSGWYLQIKKELLKRGIQILDTNETINPRKINTMESYGVEYDFSVYYPSERNEIMEAEEARNNWRKIMQQMIGGNWDATLGGYWIGPTPMGYQSKRIKVQEKKHRYILEPHDEEGRWFQKMFENRLLGVSDQRSVKEINDMGFKSRTQNIHDRTNKTLIVRQRGGVKLTVKQLRTYLENPIYAGIMIKKMTHNKPVKGSNWVPIATIEEWNKANEGRKKIVELDGEIRVIKKQPEPWRLNKTKDNPEFPYKWILCPQCRKPLHASASTVPSEGRRNPAYHCTSRGHNFRIKQATFDDTLKKFIGMMKFRDDVLLDLKRLLIEDYEKERQEVQKDSIYLEDRVIQIAAEQLQLGESIGKTSLTPVIKQLEAKYQELENEKLELIEKRNKKEEEGIDINKIITKVWHFLHNFEEGMLGQANPIEKSIAFKSCFSVMPSYEDLRLAVEVGTLKNGRLRRHIELISKPKTTDDISAPSARLELTTSTSATLCSIH